MKFRMSSDNIKYPQHEPLEFSKQGTIMYFTGLITLLLQIHWGYSQGFSAVLISQLQEHNSRLHVSNEEISWIEVWPVSLFSIAMVFGSLFTGVLMEMYGRKTAIQLSLSLTFIGWVCILPANNVLVLYISRIMNGMAAGTSAAVTVYITEITMPRTRLILLSLTGPTVLIGTVISYILGHYLFWKHMAIVYTTTSLSSILILFVIPESPTWLIANNKMAKALESLKWLKPETDFEIIITELQDLETQRPSKKGANDGELKSYVQMASRAWKPFLILEIFFFLQQFSGYNVLLYYNIQFYEIFYLPVDTFVSCTGYGITCITAFLLFIIIVRMVDRKTLTVLSATGMCITYSVAAVYQYWVATQVEKPFYWLPIICTWMSVAFGTLGIIPLPWQLAGELFPTQVRGVLSGLVFTTAFLYIFILVKIFPVLVLPYLKIYELLAIFAVVSFAAIFFGIFVLPETRGKTLAEIEALW